MSAEFRQLTHLLAVAEKGTIGKAAESLGISQPALTKSIRTLEAALQVQLLERRPRGVFPTMYGDAVIARARSVRLQMHDLLNELQSLRAGIGGVIRIGMAQGVASRLIPLATLRILADHPNVRFSVMTGAVDRLVSLLTAGDIEFAVTPFGRLSFGLDVVEEFLFHDRPMIVLRADHPLAGHTQLQPEQLLKCKWVLSDVSTPLRRAFDQIFVSDNLPTPTPTIESDSVIYTKSILMQTDFASFFPRDQIMFEEQAGLLKCIPVKTDIPPRPVGILRRRSETLSSFGQLLIGAIRGVCRDLEYVTEAKGTARTVA
jgi:DNA-binding transcriptional LysR family regulator